MKLNYSAKISTFLRYGIKISSFRQLSTLKVYSTLSKTKEPLKFRHGNNLLWYCCGPTVIIKFFGLIFIVCYLS